MKRILTLIFVAAVCFASGASAAIFWLKATAVEIPVSQEATANVDDSLPKSEPYVLETSSEKSKDAEEFFRVYGDERYRHGSTWVRRSRYSDIVGRLSEYVEKFGRSRVNTFYISEPENDGASEWTYAYWKENSVVLIIGPPYNVEDATLLEQEYFKSIDLKTGVVATEEEVGGSNYLVTRAFANDLIDKCVKRGLKVTIDKSRFTK